MEIKSFVFDMDGLMVETESLYGQALTEIAYQKRKKISQKTRYQIMGRDAIDGMTIFKKDLDLKESVLEILDQREKIYKELLTNAILEPLSGLIELLNLLKKMQFQIALASSSQRCWIDIILEKLNIASFFEIIVSRNEVKKSKPDPEIYLLAAKKLNLNPNQCLALEDTIPGIESAKKAGMKCIAIPNKFNKNENFFNADLVLNSLCEIDENFLKNFCR
ncbi:MAG: HAD family phosphatase [bacterium]